MGKRSNEISVMVSAVREITWYKDSRGKIGIIIPTIFIVVSFRYVRREESGGMFKNCSILSYFRYHCFRHILCRQIFA